MIDFKTNHVKTSDGKSSIVIVKHLGDIPGGVALDLSLLAAETKTVLAGHVILKKDSKYYAAPVTGNAYAAFGDKTPAGILVADILAEVPMASCLTMGQVRASAAPYPYTDEVKKALPNIQFL